MRRLVLLTYIALALVSFSGCCLRKNGHLRHCGRCDCAPCGCDPAPFPLEGAAPTTAIIEAPVKSLPGPPATSVPGPPGRSVSSSPGAAL